MVPSRLLIQSALRTDRGPRRAVPKRRFGYPTVVLRAKSSAGTRLSHGYSRLSRRGLRAETRNPWRLGSARALVRESPMTCPLGRAETNSALTSTDSSLRDPAAVSPTVVAVHLLMQSSHRVDSHAAVAGCRNRTASVTKPCRLPCPREHECLAKVTGPRRPAVLPSQLGIGARVQSDAASTSRRARWHHRHHQRDQGDDTSTGPDSTAPRASRSK